MISSNLFDLFSIDIIESPNLPAEPKLKLSKECPCSDTMRDSFNAYLEDMFGYKENVVYMIDCESIGMPIGKGKMIVANTGFLNRLIGS